MKKIIPSLLVGVVLGGGAAWVVLHKTEADAKLEAKPAGPAITAGGVAGANQRTLGSPIAATLAPEAKGFGRVLDVGPLVAAEEEIKAARAVADGSAKEFARTKALHDNGENASQAAVDAAEAASLRDAALLSAARAKLVTAWGRALAEKADLAALVHSLAVGEAALARIDLLPGDAPEKIPATARVSPLTGEGALREAEVLGPAPAADPQAQGVSYLALLRDAPPAPGTALRATLAVAGEPQKVLVVPRSAIVRHEGKALVFVQTADGGFQYRAVEVARNLPDGVAITGDVAEADKIIVSGAQQLLADQILKSLAPPEE
ncbi:MAG: hypothetical protein WCL04_05295 [Verrucomicrobiota bacterium]